MKNDYKNGIIIDYENCVRCGCELRGIGFDDGLCDDCYDDDLDDKIERLYSENVGEYD